MHYNLIITDRADELIDERVNYLVNRLKNQQAAAHLLDGIEQIYDRLEENPYQFADCRDIFLKSKGYKEAVVSDMDYIMIFRIEEMDVLVVGFFHQLENYNLKL
ncbi:type II toxin-antitoxin system RelE/ParE family toxin [Clostridium sp. C105KSO13]|jgi:plasmid stabilization system protein ParE|uniref:type II toxin-antitoxin system RelE/ParE family toxin n=1 Tax=Clostridium sp. C105KSO13 TaxID=1776045 RepID=UPI0007408253|nr:type II toxin-antitoxin system RelE/ParE family toxin [Clostridium sp. C105KSO13]CUX14924.1 Plasmid stabilization system protein [Clostridium sp. C105KSO13]